MVITSTSGAEFGEDASVLEQSASLAKGLLLLIAMIPVLVGEHEVRLTCQGEKWDLIKNSLNPKPLDHILNISQVVIATRILYRCELDVNLLRRLELERGQVPEVGMVEVWALLLQESNLLVGHADIGKSYPGRRVNTKISQPE
jgi:hypothetical protein